MAQADTRLVSSLLFTSLSLLACSPSQVHLDPRNVTAVSLKLPTPEPTFCPGQPLRLELRAQLKDGSTCSSNDPQAVCMGQKGALIDPSDVRIQGSSGVLSQSGADFLWNPPPDPLATAVVGMTLRAWLEATAEGAPQKSPAAQLDLRPVYHCMRENVFSHPRPAAPGQDGSPGPDLKVSVTTLTTPFYPEALLVRVEHGGRRAYIISTDRSQPISIISKGQTGAPGFPGTPGSNGMDGQDGSSRSSSICEPGRPGGSGTDGRAGGTGGRGGPGGTIQLFIDEAVMEKARGWLGVASIGGDPGARGVGGAAGQGGRGGRHSDIQGCSAADGVNGSAGMRGPDGDPGQRGLNGPPPVVTAASRQSIFADDLPLIQQIEATARPKS
jgi:hypothetical protein